VSACNHRHLVIKTLDKGLRRRGATATVISTVAACAGDRGRVAHHSSSENFLVHGGGR
jgi:hypothetical protein